MTLREQASERLTDAEWAEILDVSVESPDCWQPMRASILDALQPLFDQVVRERKAIAERFGVELSSDGQTWFSVCDDGEREHDTFAEAVIATLWYVENDLKLAETTQHEARTEAHQLRRERDELVKQLDAAMCPHCDQTIERGHAPDCPVALDVTIELADLRAKLTQAEADRDRWSEMADKLHAQVANQRAALDRG